MKYGKMSGKDFDGSHDMREHSRRDDARFEERMARGGELTYDDFMVGDFYFNSSEGGKFKFVGKDESGRLRFQDSKGIDRIFSPKRMSKYADGGIMARGGYVSKGELVWKKLTKSERMKFLHENFTPQITPRTQETLVGKDYNFLPKNVKIVMESKYANVENYADGGKMEENIKIKDFYINEFPTDDMGEDINPNATFNGLHRVLNRQGDVYEYMGVVDSLVRERVFEKLANIKGVDYNEIYNLWLKSDDEFKNGGMMAHGGKTEDYYEQLAVYVQGRGEIYRGTSMKKALKEANDYLAKNPKAEITVVDDKYGDEYDLNGNLKDEYAKGGRLKEEDDSLLGYEPYFEKYVGIASIDRENKIVRPSHGYFPKHPMSKKAINWAKKHGYDYIADGKKYADGGMMAEGGEVYYVRDFYPNYDEDKIASILKSIGAKKVRKAKLYGYSNQPDVVVFEGDKDKAQEILEKEFPDNYISIYEKDWGRKMADGGEIKVINLSDDDKLNYFINKQDLVEKQDRESDDYTFINDMLTSTYDGKKFYSLGYDTPDKGRVFSLEEAKKNARIITDSQLGQKWDVIIKEVGGAFGEQDFTKKVYVVMTSPLFP